jgi:flagellin-like hook-associated protein FlgL
MSRSQVLLQAGVSVLAQANQLPQVALKLLAG